MTIHLCLKPEYRVELRSLLYHFSLPVFIFIYLVPPLRVHHATDDRKTSRTYRSDRIGYQKYLIRGAVCVFVLLSIDSLVVVIAIIIIIICIISSIIIIIIIIFFISSIIISIIIKIIVIISSIIIITIIIITISIIILIIKSYLEDISYSVVIDECDSELVIMTHGVPHVSILGPLIFIFILAL